MWWLKKQSSSVWWIPHDSLLQQGSFQSPSSSPPHCILHGTSVWRPRRPGHQGPARTSVVDASAEDHVDFVNLAWLSSSEKFGENANIQWVAIIFHKKYYIIYTMVFLGGYTSIFSHMYIFRTHEVISKSLRGIGEPERDKNYMEKR